MIHVTCQSFDSINRLGRPRPEDACAPRPKEREDARPTRQPLRTEVAAEELAAYDRVVERAADPDRQLFVLAQQATGTEVPVQQDAGYYGRLLHSPKMAYHLLPSLDAWCAWPAIARTATRTSNGSSSTRCSASSWIPT